MAPLMLMTGTEQRKKYGKVCQNNSSEQNFNINLLPPVSLFLDPDKIKTKLINNHSCQVTYFIQNIGKSTEIHNLYYHLFRALKQ